MRLSEVKCTSVKGNGVKCIEVQYSEVNFLSVMLGDGLNPRHLLEDDAECLLQLPDLIERLVLVGLWLVALYRGLLVCCDSFGHS